MCPERLTKLNTNESQLNALEKHYDAVLFPKSESGKASKGRWTTLWLLISVVLPPVVAFGILYWQRISVPYQDDYAVILAFANDYRQLHGFAAKALDVATAQSNDYKLGFVHFIVALELELTGRLNFGFLITLGNLLLLAIAYLLWRVHRREGSDLDQQLLEFVPVSLLFFPHLLGKPELGDGGATKSVGDYVQSAGHLFLESQGYEVAAISRPTACLWLGDSGGFFLSQWFSISCRRSPPALTKKGRSRCCSMVRGLCVTVRRLSLPLHPIFRFG